MKILNKRELREKTSISIQHWTRMEQQGRAPRRIKLVPGGIRVGWLESEVDDFLRQRIAERDSKK